VKCVASMKSLAPRIRSTILRMGSTVITYSYHWADAANQLITRWDNTPHFPDLPGFPDHIHNGATGEVTPGQPMSIFAVLDAIADRIR
jgi:aromatic ring-opening dioxygenase catalytic subunit (LigB family)